MNDSRHPLVATSDGHGPLNSHRGAAIIDPVKKPDDETDPPSAGACPSGDAAESDPPGSTAREATRLLARIDDGDALAAQDLLPIVYAELRARAGAYLNSPGPHTLQPTALVHEAYLRLIKTKSDWKNRGHFCAIAAKAMRQILMNHAEAKRAAKRTPPGSEVVLEEVSTPSDAPPVDLIALDDALQRLGEIDEKGAQLVELRFFGGLTNEEVARHEGVSARAIEKRWRRTRAWLNRELGGNAPT